MDFWTYTRFTQMRTAILLKGRDSINSEKDCITKTLVKTCNKKHTGQVIRINDVICCAFTFHKSVEITLLVANTKSAS